MRDCRLECVQAVIERQKRMPAEANDDRLFLDRQHRRSRFLWSRPSVHDRAARLPLAHRLLIDAVTSGERSQALFTMLYRSTDRLSRRGAPVKNLAHSASFDSCHKNAPSKCGTKHPRKSFGMRARRALRQTLPLSPSITAATRLSSIDEPRSEALRRGPSESVAASCRLC